MKKHKKCILIALAVVIGWYLTIDIIGAVRGENLFFFERWIFSDRGYAKNIEISSYVLSGEQIITLLKNSGEKIDQPRNKDLYNKNVYLVIGLKNNRGKVCWGSLMWNENGSNWFEIAIWDIPPSHVSTTFSYYFISLGNVVLFNNDSLPQKIKFKWKSLYTYS